MMKYITSVGTMCAYEMVKQSPEVRWENPNPVASQQPISSITHVQTEGTI